MCLQEVERFWQRSAMVDQPQEIGNLMNDYYWAYCPAFDTDASTRSPDGLVFNRRRQFGTMILSRYPIRSARPLVLPQLPTFNVLGMTTGALEGVIDCPKGALRVYSVHLSSASIEERLIQIDALLSMHRNIEACGSVMTMQSTPTDRMEAANYQQMNWSNSEPEFPVPEHVLFLGDFNFTENSPEYTRFLGVEDQVYGRGMHSGSLVDSWDVARERTDHSLTWWPDPPDRLPGCPLRLDYCFVNTELAHRIIRAWVDQNALGSDHRPYWIELDW